jgi:uncharacterized membrane protein YgdD (TMEM256/DUF423 family)
MGALSVGLGAFGAHALKARLDERMLEVWETAVRYQFYHVFALFGLGLLMAHVKEPSTVMQASGWLFVAGVVLFSGSLYAMALSGVRVLGAITPIGGLCFIAGWLALGHAAWRA